ncbi:endomucin isoform X2 [Sceloporus undulatus]|uniref:endomucin isoform X2 n=1 Tax=Sceloporus undulatus TaxID=8520 RepID=UPI001C4D4EB0|nr:endomucin isoform X2 [Sceloporus undulatus]
MSAGHRIMTMKLFGTVLFSLAFFSSCSGDVGAEGTSGNSTTTAPEPPKGIPTSARAGSGSPTVAGSITKPAVNITLNTTSPATTTTQPTSNSKTGPAESSTRNPMATPKPNSTVATADKSNTTTARPDIQNSTVGTPQKATETTPTISFLIDTTDPGRDGALSTSDNAAKTDQGGKEDSSYSSIILPVIIAVIVISLAIFLLMALYKICLKTTPERQENGTEQAPSDKENVKLISVKTTSPETGEQASQGKNKTRQPNDSSSHPSNKCV